MRFVIIANGHAGKGRGAHVAERVQSALRSGGAHAAVVFTSRSGQAEELAAEIAGQPPDGALCIAACGGDGTVQEVVNGLMRTAADRAVLGVIPGGRCNDLAAALGMPSEPGAIAETLLQGQPRPIDLGRAGGRYFCTIAAFGFDAAVSRFVHSMRMPLSGTPAYVYGVLRTLRRYQPVHARLTLDGEALDAPVLMVASANTSTYGGQMHIAPQADPRDGVLDICLVQPMGAIRVLRLLRRAIAGRHGDLPEVRFVRARRLTIETPAPQELWADGEPLARTPVTIEVAPSAIRVLGDSRNTSGPLPG